MKQFLKNLIIPNYKNSFHPFLIRKPLLVLYTACLLTVNFLSPNFRETAYAGSVKSSVLVEMLNNERRAHGLNELNIDSRLVTAAYDKAEDIFDKQYWSHYGPSGETPWQFILGSGYDYVYAGENLAKGFNSSEGVHNAWMASKTHRENMLNANYQDVGIAVVPGELNGEYVILVVEMFGSLSSEPAESLPETYSVLGNYEIDITFPNQGDILADNFTRIKGRAGSGGIVLNLFDNEEEIADLICEEGVWDYRPDKPWSEGEHTIRVEDEEQISVDEVEFVIDTVAPEIHEDSFSITDKTGGAVDKVEALVRVEGAPKEVVLMVGELSRDMESKGDDTYVTDVPQSALESKEKISIFAVDAAGNNNVVDVSGDVLGSNSNDQIDNAFLGITLNSKTITIFNRLVLLVIIVLLVIDSIYLLKLNILHTRGKTLFPMVIWVLILGIGLAMGTGGTIR